MNRLMVVALAALIFTLLILDILMTIATKADPLPPQLTYCSNGSEVVIVDNHTCPAGYWRI